MFHSEKSDLKNGAPSSTHKLNRTSAGETQIKQKLVRLAFCPKCRKGNIPLARFCGKCGSFLSNEDTVKSENPPVKTGSENVQRLFPTHAKVFVPFPRNSPAQDARQIRNSIGELPSPSVASTQAPQLSKNQECISKLDSTQPKRIGIWLLKKFQERSSMIITLGIILVTFSPYFEYFSGFWLFSNNGSGEKILWSDLRSHISRHVGLTLHEVDNLAEASLGEIPAINSQMTCDEAIKIEAFLISASGVDISLFQNLHQTGYLQRTNLLDSTSQQKLITFSDVPLDHPVYVAWRALLRLEIFPVDSLNRVRVHDPIRWDDWKSVIEALDNRLELNGKLQSSLNVDHRGIMCGQDVQESLVILRQVLELKEISLFSGISPDFVPNRLEAFGAISQLIEETSKQG